MPDAHKNFAYSTVATAPSPDTTGTSLVVQTGDGVKFPTPPFNATVWPAGDQPLTTNAEIVRVTAISGDTLTITRTQESTTTRAILVSDQIAATITAKTLTDVETTWQSYTPVWTAVTTNPSIGNGSLTGRYALAGNLVTVQIHLVIGSTTNLGSGPWRFSLPVNSGPGQVSVLIGLTHALDAGTARHGAMGLLVGNNRFLMVSSGAAAEWASNVPFAWVAGDEMDALLTYEK